MKFVKLISFASLLALVASGLQAAVTVTSVSDPSPTVTFAGSVSPVTTGQTLEAGLLETNSATVVIVLENGSTLSLSPGTSIMVGGLSGAAPVAEITGGSIAGTIIGTLRVISAGGDAVISGGSFAVSTDGASVQVANASASVAVIPAGTTTPRPVTVGQSATVSPTGQVSVSGLTQAQMGLIGRVPPPQPPMPVTPPPPPPIPVPDPDGFLVDVEVASRPG